MSEIKEAITLCNKHKYEAYANALKQTQRVSMPVLKAKNTKELFQVLSKEKIQPQLYNKKALRPQFPHSFQRDPYGSGADLKVPNDPMDFSSSLKTSQALHPNPSAYYHTKEISIDGYSFNGLLYHLESGIRNALWKESIVTACKLLQAILFHRKKDDLISLHGGAQKRVTSVFDVIILTCIKYCTPDARLIRCVLNHIAESKKILNKMKGKTETEYNNMFYSIVNHILAVVSTLVGVPKSYNL